MGIEHSIEPMFPHPPTPKQLTISQNTLAFSRRHLYCHGKLIIGNWNAKVGSQETPGVTGKFGLGIWNEAGQRLIEFCQENALVIANTLFQQHKRRLYTWTSPDGQH